MLLTRPGPRTAAMLTALLCATAVIPASAGSAAADTPTGRATALRTDGMADPLGIDDTAPRLSWQLPDAGHDRQQSAYQIRAAADRALLEHGHATLWDTGRVKSATSTGVAYAGRKLTSRQHVVWQVRTWDQDGRASAWSSPADFEMGLLNKDDWSADWIANPDWLHREPTPVTVDVGDQDARYLRLDVTRLGLPLTESGKTAHRLQLSEIVVSDSGGTDPGTDLARGAAVTASDDSPHTGSWETPFVTDGKLDSDNDPRGYTSKIFPGDTPDGSTWLQLDLGSARHFDTVRLYPRTDTLTSDQRTPNFPVDFTLATASDPQGPFTTAARRTGQAPPPPYLTEQPRLPLLARQFTLDKQVADARLYATGVGIYDATLNGKPVSRAVLEPPNTDYAKRVVYSTYDVTRLLRRHGNTLGVQLGNGTYNIPPTPGRYEKYTGVQGPPKALMQLEITYTDGSTARIGTDDSWRTTLGPTTFSNWYGGEDADARLAQPGWDTPGSDLSGWQRAETTTPPAPGTELSARMDPPVEPAGTMRTATVTQPRPGTYVFDLGSNFAGWEELHIKGPKGTEITMKPGERLGPDGLVDQGTMIAGGNTSPPIVDHYTLAGRGTETWHPRFMYHGLRYLQVTGLPGKPTKDTVTGIVLRAANASAGTFSSSSGLLNDTHALIGRALDGNMLSIPTDCPDREKLGWLEESHLEFGTLSGAYDVAAYYRDFLRSMTEAQESSGLVPDIVPQYAHFTGDVHDEPNWGSAVIMAAWKAYRAYGDPRYLSDNYATQQTYFDYLTGKTKDGILDYGLGDWGASDTSTPTGVTATYAYYEDADTLARIADVLHKPDDAARYRALAKTTATAFNTAYLDHDHGTYATGTQAADALALDMGIVPESDRAAVLDHLVASLHAAGDHTTVGEIALPALFRVLSAAGRDDVVWDIADNTSGPSYGDQLVNGATSLTEYWDGATGYGSQNHWMIGAIDDWFRTGLAGLDQAPDSVGYHDLTVRPAVVGTLTHVEDTYQTPYGTAASAWRRSGHTLTLKVTVPPNSSATVEVPASAGTQGVTAPHGAHRLTGTKDRARYHVGSGSWTFTARTATRAPKPQAAQLGVNGPDSSIPAVPGHTTTAHFQLHNFTTHQVTVHPKVTASKGFTARPGSDKVTIPAKTTRDLPLRVTTTAAKADGTKGTVTVAAGDRTTAAPAAVTDDLATIADMTASSSHSGSSPRFLNDGVTDSSVWHNAVGGWQDNTNSAFPDTVTATWPRAQTIGRVTVNMLDSTAYPAASYAASDYDIQLRTATGWQTVGTVRGNTAGEVTTSFTPARATALRLTISGSRSTYSRLMEVQAFAH